LPGEDSGLDRKDGSMACSWFCILFGEAVGLWRFEKESRRERTAGLPSRLCLLSRLESLIRLFYNRGFRAHASAIT